MRIPLALAALLVASSCTKTPATTAPEPSGGSTVATPPVAMSIDAGASAPPVDAAPVCTDDQAKKRTEARSSAMRMFVAMESQGPHRTANEAWVATDPACRDGRWYYVAVLLMSFTPGPIEAPGVKLATIEDALAAALQLPDDVEILARVAYNAHLGRTPALPTGACDRAKAVGGADSDRIAYVCGHASLAAGDGKAAVPLFEAVHSRLLFLDIDLVAAEAAKLAGDKPATKKFATAAAKAGYDAANKAMVSSADAKLVAAAAKALLK